MSASFRLRSVVLGTPAPRELAAFYRRMLGGDIVDDEADWVVLQTPGGGRLAFQLEEDHVLPAWPARAGEQQMQVHLDISVDDLTAAVAHATACGAAEASWQPQDDVRVMIDPAGHPFCLFELG